MQSLDYKYLAMCVKDSSTRHVPVTAILVKDDVIIDMAHSLRDTVKGKLETIRITHAEFPLVTRQSLSGCALYTTLEPCIACAGLAVMGTNGVARLVWALDDKWAGFTSLYKLDADYFTSHKPEIIPSPYADLNFEARQLWVNYISKIHHDDATLKDFYIAKLLGQP